MIEWRDVKGYEGLYQVSNNGLVRSVDRVTTGNRHRNLNGKLLEQNTNEFGYLMVHPCKDGKSKTKRVHRLVAEAFIPNIDNKPYINHKDGNPQNNNVENLEWCTQKENVQHALDTGLRQIHCTLTKGQVEYIRKVYIPYDRQFGTSALARQFGVNQTTVWSALKGVRVKEYSK